MILLNQNIAHAKPLADALNQTTVNVVQHFYAQEKIYPYQIAIVEKDRSINYNELKEEVLKTARYFRKAGIQKGDRVLVFVPVSISLYRIVLALFHIGATAVFLDEWSTRERLKKACEVADCRAFIGNWKAKAMGMLIKQIRQIPIWLSSRLPHHEATSTAPIEVNNTDPALITFTTGSTGLPKAADRTHHFLNAQMDALNEELGIHPGMVDMAALPIFVLLNLGGGLISILPDANMRKPKSIKISNIVQQLEDHSVQRIIASPFLVKAIAQYLIANKLKVASLKEVYTGGAPIFPNDAKLFLEGFGPIKMEAVYGSTEAEPISNIEMSTLAESEIKAGLPVGEVAPCTSINIIQYQDAEIEGAEFIDVILPPGDVGEIVVTGDHVLKEYYKNLAAVCRNKIKQGNKVWHRTGDAGYLDEHGQLHLVGRCAQLIYLNEKMYSPFLYEYLLQQVEGVEMGTILENKGRLLVVIETQGDYDRTALNEIFESEEIKIVQLSKIPRDPRHHSKVDYGKLDLILNGKL